MRLKSIAGLAGIASAVSSVYLSQTAEGQPAAGFYRLMARNASDANSNNLATLNTSNVISAMELSQLRFEEAKSVKPGEPINPFLNSLTSLRIENEYDEKDDTIWGGYRRKSVFGEGAYRDSKIIVLLYPYKYQDGNFDVKFSLEGVLMGSFSGEFQGGKEMIKAGTINIFDYVTLNETSPIPDKDRDGFWDM